jgi:hypothetical protein
MKAPKANFQTFKINFPTKSEIKLYEFLKRRFLEKAPFNTQ